MRWMVFTPDSVPRPRRVVASSLSQGMSAADRAGRARRDLADDPAAVDMLPVRAGVVASDRLAVEQERRDRLAERPGQAAGARLALVDLRAFGLQRHDDRLARRGDRRRHLGVGVTRCQGECGALKRRVPKDSDGADQPPAAAAGRSEQRHCPAVTRTASTNAISMPGGSGRRVPERCALAASVPSFSSHVVRQLNAAPDRSPDNAVCWRS